MKISFIITGKTSSNAVKMLCDDYLKRIQHYVKIEQIIIESSGSKIPDLNKAKQKEGELILKKITPADFIILLDAEGKQYTSQQFAAELENLFNRSLKNVCFIIGGAYGFSDELYRRANSKISLSKMTFSHQIVRALFLEQLYRAFTIINKEPYHH